MFSLESPCRFMNGVAVRFALVLVPFITAPLSNASVIANPCFGAKHCTDGGFNLHNGGSQTSNGPEWAGGNVVEKTFAVVGNAGGGFLYVDQGVNGDNNLYLMYDYPTGTPDPANSVSSFDVFFQVPSDQTDYAVRITGGGFSAFEKPNGVQAPLSPDGSFDLSSPVWTPLNNTDLQLAKFKGAVGFGASPNSPTSHLMAEFQLSVNRAASGNTPTGFYDPSPAFWSASVKTVCKGCVDPPISSGIFTLNPDGTTTVTPVFGPNGGPLQQPGIPEPSSALLLGTGLALFFFRRSK